MDFDLSTPMRAIIGAVLVASLLGVVFWLVKRFAGERLSNTGGRGRQPRLAVIDAASVDGRRRLVLIRRDNVEHLLMIGGPTDVVVETNIVRAAGAPREAAQPRPSAASDTLPRPVPLGEETMWPLQPDGPARPDLSPRPEGAPRLEAPARPEPPLRADAPARPELLRSEQPSRGEPPARPQRGFPPPPTEERTQWSADKDAPSAPLGLPPRERRPRSADPLAGLADELARTPSPQQQAPAMEQPSRQSPPRRETRLARPQSQPGLSAAPSAASTAAEADASPAADQNLAEMAQRLEAALRRPPQNEEGRSGASGAGGSSGVTTPEPGDSASASTSARPTRDARPARSEGRPASQQKSLYDSLEQEMASLLGRPEKT
ncbi:MAG: flagellar biosynthetic protein FliO [Xanthobacteraceae bacterium]